jgi:hypothetical protein
LASSDTSQFATLDHLLHSHNPFFHVFRRARDVLDEHPRLSSLRLTPQLQLITNNNDDPRRYNLPTVNHELAAVMPDILSEFGQCGYCNVILHLCNPSAQPADLISDRLATAANQGLTQIYPNHTLYLPLYYVLFYPAGGRGYYRALHLTGTTNTGENRTRTSMSARMFYCFHFHT